LKVRVAGQITDVTNEKAPEKIPWGKSCPKYVVDATGLYKSYDKASVVQVL
jgi:glyceraldehyde-3-phosphate dehydrogenase/erythrose-4-phosphate dehydrogenase